MRYNKIRKVDLSDGPGLRVAIYVQGCTFNCKGCFNTETHDFNKGKEFTQEEMNDILRYSNYDHVSGLSVLGGEPLHPRNIQVVNYIITNFHNAFPDKTIWVWSGFKIEDLLARNDEITNELLKQIDVLVDGQFKIDQINSTLRFCGSDNQRVINVPKTLEQKRIVLYPEK